MTFFTTMDFLKTVAAASLGAFLSLYAKELLGYLSNRARSIETRRDLDLDLLEEVVFELRDLARDYWSQPDVDGDKKPTGAAITGRLFFIGQLADRLFQEDDSLKESVKEKVNRFDNSISNGNFDVTNRNSDPERITGIEIDAYTLAHEAVVSRRKLGKKFLVVW